MLGDSYNIAESADESDRWPNQLFKNLTENGSKVETEIIAKTGRPTCELLKTNISSKNLGTGYHMILLLIGVNNHY